MVSRWQAKPDFPQKTKRGYHVQTFRKWREGFQENRAAAAAAVPESARKRLLRAQADERESKAALAKLQLQVERGEFLRRDEIQKRDEERIHAIKRGLLSIERTLPPRLVGLQEKEMSAVLRKFSRDLVERFRAMSW